ncbi:hypothetical protein K439DRAFT_1625450 [Ramaria rubella]|nr:hypothetical protein K439DRAFT_1625450 [Ramaria rubella]
MDVDEAGVASSLDPGAASMPLLSKKPHKTRKEVDDKYILEGKCVRAPRIPHEDPTKMKKTKKLQKSNPVQDPPIIALTLASIVPPALIVPPAFIIPPTLIVPPAPGPIVPPTVAPTLALIVAPAPGPIPVVAPTPIAPNIEYVPEEDMYTEDDVYAEMDTSLDELALSYTSPPMDEPPSPIPIKKAVVKPATKVAKAAQVAKAAKARKVPQPTLDLDLPGNAIMKFIHFSIPAACNTTTSVIKVLEVPHATSFEVVLMRLWTVLGSTAVQLQPDLMFRLQYEKLSVKQAFDSEEDWGTLKRIWPTEVTKSGPLLAAAIIIVDDHYLKSLGYHMDSAKARATASSLPYVTAGGRKKKKGAVILNLNATNNKDPFVDRRFTPAQQAASDLLEAALTTSWFPFEIHTPNALGLNFCTALQASKAPGVTMMIPLQSDPFAHFHHNPQLPIKDAGGQHGVSVLLAQADSSPALPPMVWQPVEQQLCIIVDCRGHYSSSLEPPSRSCKHPLPPSSDSDYVPPIFPTVDEWLKTIEEQHGPLPEIREAFIKQKYLQTQINRLTLVSNEVFERCFKLVYGDVDFIKQQVEETMKDLGCNLQGQCLRRRKKIRKA